MVLVTSSKDNSDTSVLPCVILGSPFGPVSEHDTLCNGYLDVVHT